MRWTLRIGAALALAWLLFLASPYVALHSLGRAIETRDVDAVRARVNFRALRLSLMRQVIGASLEERGGRALGATERQLAADAATTVADPIVSQLLTPEAIIALLNEGWPAGVAGSDGAETAAAPSPRSLPGSAVATMRVGSVRNAVDLFRNSELRGFRNLLVSLPPSAPAEQQFRLRLRLVRTTWKLVTIELPEALLRRALRQFGQRPRRGDAPAPPQ
jgi:Protein of unknown function (DUF2939)